MPGNTVMKLAVELGLDSEKFKKGMGDAHSTATKVANGIGLGLGALAATATVAFAAAGAVLVKSISSASDLNESLNAVNVVFGESASVIKAYGETSATSVGMSTQAFSQMSAVTGSFLQNLGFDAASAATETIKLTERAADMASIFNTDVSQAMAAIQSGLKGEFNPLEQFGVKLNAATVEAKALSMGLTDVTYDVNKINLANLEATKAQQDWNSAVSMFGAHSEQAIVAQAKLADAQDNLAKAQAGTAGALTDSMKTQAMLALIYEQTDAVAGDFANTSDGLANSQRILTATFEDIKASLGTLLLPLLQEAVGVLKDFATGVKGVLEGSGTLDEKMTGIGQLAGGLIEGLSGVVPQLLTMGIAIIEGLIKGIVSALPQMVPMAMQVLMGFVGYLIDMLPLILEVGFQIIVAIALGIAEALPTLIPAIVNMLMNMVMIIIENIPLLIDAALQIVIGLVNGIIAAIPVLIEAIPQLIEAIFSAIMASLPVIFKAALNIILALIEGIITVLPLIFEMAPEIVGMLVGGILEAVPLILECAAELIKGLINALIEMWPDIKQAGVDIITGFWEGLKSMFEDIWEDLKNFGASIVDVFNNIFGIKSPSKVFAKIGENLMLGLASGIEDAANLPQDALSNLLPANPVQLNYNNIVGQASTSIPTIQSGFSREDKSQTLLEEIVNLLREQPIKTKVAFKEAVALIESR